MVRVAAFCVMLSCGVLPPLGSGCHGLGHTRYEPRTFLGYDCEGDCRRHKAGFRWAEQRAVTDPWQCGALQHAEAEGCAAFIEEGRDAVAAGEAWAVENEIAHQSDCLGAGERFLAGCARQLELPTNTY